MKHNKKPQMHAHTHKHKNTIFFFGTTQNVARKGVNFRQEQRTSNGVRHGLHRRFCSFFWVVLARGLLFTFIFKLPSVFFELRLFEKEHLKHTKKKKRLQDKP